MMLLEEFVITTLTFSATVFLIWCIWK